MILNAEIISQPISGQFKERIYDFDSEWKSSTWTWVKFTDENQDEWCGNFRGRPKGVGVSAKNNIILVLTSDCLYSLDNETANVIEYFENYSYNQLTTTPNGDFLISDSYNIFKVTNSIEREEKIKSPISMDSIKFKGWQGTKLAFQCDEFMAWDNHYIMEYDSETDKIIIKNKEQQAPEWQT